MESHSQAILVEDLKKSFQHVHALQGVHLAVPRGKVMALLGPNGAGKTTLVRILTTLLRPDSGRAFILGHDVTQHAHALRSIIGLAGQYAAIDENLTGRENLELVGRLYHMPKKEARRRAAYLLERFGLQDAGNRVTKTYSGGMRRRLDLAASLIGGPQILFLDEPTTGLDLPSRLGLWEVIKQLVAGGTTLLLTTQYLEEADHLADRIAVIDHGRIIAEGSPSELKSRVAGHTLEVHVADKNAVKKAAEALRHLGRGEPHIDMAQNRITLPVQAGSAIIADAVRLLDNAQIDITNLALHRPTLDDVFLSLTDHRPLN